MLVQAQDLIRRTYLLFIPHLSRTVIMNALALRFISLIVLLCSSSQASLLPVLKAGLEGLDNLFNTKHSLSSILFPDPVEAKNITIKLGFIGALDKSLGATATLGQELVSFFYRLLNPISLLDFKRALTDVTVVRYD